MAFCKYCGRELQENEVCSCREESSVHVENTPETVPQAVVVPSASAFDINKILAFLKEYFINPDQAVSKAVGGTDKTCLIACAVLFALSNALAQLSIGINTHYFYGLFLLFGVLFGVIGILLPCAADICVAMLGKVSVSKKVLLKKIVLHTPYTSMSLLLTFLLGVFSYKAFAVMAILTAIIFAVSMGSVFMEIIAKIPSSLLKKVYVVTAVVGYVLVINLLFALEGRAVEEAIINNIQSLIFTLLNLFMG